jgi:hypothetical protein
MISSSIISSDETTKRPTPSPAWVKPRTAPSGTVTQELFKPSIQLEEDIPALTPGTSPGEDSPIPMPGTPPGKGGMAPTSGADLGTPARPIGQNREPGGEIAAIIRPPGPDTDWQKPTSEYRRCGMIPDDETETRHLARRSKGYKFAMMSCIASAPQASFSGASPLRKVRSYSSILMRGSVDTMLRQEAWSERLSNKVSTGRGPLAMSRRS